jgi:alpha-galactosidase
MKKRMNKPKIAFIGAGSTVFARRLIADILSFEELSEVTLSLFDIDSERLATSAIVAHKLRDTIGAQATIETPSDRREALDGADYVICMIQVAGYRPGTVVDFEVPKKYGLRQTIADTLGIGGIMRGLRTAPVLLEICREMEELCPDAIFLNHVNPMAINCWVINRASKVKTIGLCHSVQGTAKQIAESLGVPVEDMNFVCAGINHMAFYLRLERHGQDLYPLLRRMIAEDRVPDTDRVRYEAYAKLGFFVTESSEHFSEYVPWFIKRDRPDLIERFNIPLDEYILRCEDQIAGWNAMRVELESANPLEVQMSGEYSPLIIHSLETGQLRMFNGNVPNEGLIDNLPQGCCVELPCVVDRNGIRPVRIGSLPPQLAALIQTNVNVQSLVVEAVLTHRRDHIYHAAMMDPHTAAELDLDQISSLVDELIEAHGAWLPEYQ